MPPPTPPSLVSRPPQLQDSSTPSAYLSALRPIDRIPVPDLASTLITSASDDDEDAETSLSAQPRLSYIRTNIEARDGVSDLSLPSVLGANGTASGPRTSSEILELHRQRITHLTNTWRNSMEERDARLDRLERVLAQLNRMQGSTATGESAQHISSSSSATTWSIRAAERAQELNRQAELARIQRESGERQAELLRIQRETRDVMRFFMSSEEAANQVQLEHQSQALQQQQHATRMQALQERSLRNGSLRAGSSVGLLNNMDRIARQDGRRHPRFWTRHRELLARSGEYLENGIGVDNGMQTDLHSEQLVSRSHAPGGPETYGTPGGRSRTRRPVMQDAGEGASSVLQDILLYLSNLRSATSREEAMAFALQAGCSYKDFGDPKFVSSLDGLAPPSVTSLMRPGAVFKGQQYSRPFSPDHHATDSDPSSIYQLPNPLPARSSSGRMTGLPTANAASASHSGSWPVKVSIYDVDYESMTLSASMEAYDVPSHPHPASPTTPTQSSGTCQKPITTFLEGEIIDLRKHTFITENFASTLSRDLTYWRKLPPFKDFSTAELPARLLSREFLAEVNSKYILMRWKERCFVSQSPSTNSSHQPRRRLSDVRREITDAFVERCNLTISGFYFASLRRSDGLIEGLYCDPQSSPYQYLSLTRVKMGAFPSWTFK